MEKYFLNGKTNESESHSLTDLQILGLQESDFVWFEGLDTWKPVGEIEELQPYIKRKVVPPPFQPKLTPPPFEPKSTPPPFQKESSITATPPPFQNPTDTQKSAASLPSNIRFGYQLARKRDRFWGDLICGLLYVVVWFFILYIQDPTNFITEDSIGGETTSFGDFMILIIIPAIFGVIFYPMWSGHIGHKVFGLKAISANDGSDFNKAGLGALREVVKSLFSILIVPTIWLLWDDNKQNLYDKVVGTYVVKKK